MASDTRALDRALAYPKFRIMGSKHRLLPWIASVLGEIPSTTALDAFSGSGAVGYLLKCLGKRVTSNDLLRFPYHIAHGLVANSRARITPNDLARILAPNRHRKQFVLRTFRGIFFTDEDNRFLDNTWANLPLILDRRKRSLILAALFQSCLRRQPRGVFTVAGVQGKYDDGRRDLHLSLRQHFLRAVEEHAPLIFENGGRGRALNQDVFSLDPSGYDLVYLDPPYVPRSDDNCYIKRYHFLEGLATYWRDVEILEDSKVRKIRKRYTPFSYRRTAHDAFARLFSHFRASVIVLSYSSNGYPDLPELVSLMRGVKPQVSVYENDHRYHFGTHGRVRRERAVVREYLIVGR